MDYQLRPAVSFCRVGDRFVFLDIARDRYFGLSEAADEAFASLVASGRLSSSERSALAPALSSGLLRETAQETRPRPCPTPPRPRQSLLDAECAAPLSEIAMLLIHRIGAAHQVRRRPLADLLGKLVERKAGLRDDDDHAGQVALVAVALRRTALLVSAHQQCLATSLAVMRRLLDRAVPADLVFGVKLRPFQAHCWVQAGDVAVSDHVDTVAMFTPILVL